MATAYIRQNLPGYYGMRFQTATGYSALSATSTLAKFNIATDALHMNYQYLLYGENLTYSAGHTLTGGLVDKIAAYDFNTVTHPLAFVFWTNDPGGLNLDVAKWLNSSGEMPYDNYNIYYDASQVSHDPTLEADVSFIGSAKNDTVVGGAGNDLVFARSGNDSLNGNGGDDSLFGGDGDDKISGGDGNDKLGGGWGNDTIDGGAGRDLLKLIESYYQDGVTPSIVVNLNNGTSTGQGSDTLISIEDVDGSRNSDTIIGNGISNKLYGNDGDDSISGGSGNDSMYGGWGSDTLAGGNGIDFFAFSPNPGGAFDTVRDFHPGEDKIELGKQEFFDTAMSKWISALTADMFAFRTDGKVTALDPTDRFIYDQKNGNLYFDSDGTGSTAPVKIAHFDNAPVLTFSDFRCDYLYNLVWLS